MRRTNWFPPAVLPVHVGVYECEWTGEELSGTWYNYWDGTTFLMGSSIAHSAAEIEGRRFLPFACLKRWRGVRP